MWWHHKIVFTSIKKLITFKSQNVSKYINHIQCIKHCQRYNGPRLLSLKLAPLSSLAARLRHLHCHIALDHCGYHSSYKHEDLNEGTNISGIELGSSSTRVTSVKSAKALSVVFDRCPKDPPKRHFHPQKTPVLGNIFSTFFWPPPPNGQKLSLKNLRRWGFPRLPLETPRPIARIPGIPGSKKYPFIKNIKYVEIHQTDRQGSLRAAGASN